MTEFYFWVALGGALGGVFTAIIAPFAFQTVLEYPLLVATIAFFRRRNDAKKIQVRDWLYPALLGGLVAVAWYVMRRARIDVTENLKTRHCRGLVDRVRRIPGFAGNVSLRVGDGGRHFSYRYALPSLMGSNPVLYEGRDFFGIRRSIYDVNSNMRRLLHGDTIHGIESQDPILSGQPISYFHEAGPVGDVIKMVSSRPDQQIGVVGLGTGSMAGWARQTVMSRFLISIHRFTTSRGTFLRFCDAAGTTAKSSSVMVACRLKNCRMAASMS